MRVGANGNWRDNYLLAIVGGDLGCLLNIEGRLRRNGDMQTRVYHFAEVAAGMTGGELFLLDPNNEVGRYLNPEFVEASPLEDQRFDSLSNLEQPVRYSYKIKVPQLAGWDGDELRLEPSVLNDLVQDMARLPSADRHGCDHDRRHLRRAFHAAAVPAGLEAQRVAHFGAAER